MRTLAHAVTIGLLCLAAPAAAQGPRRSTRAWPKPSPPAALSYSRRTDLGAPALTWRPDSLAIRPTHWLEGGIIGAVLIGFAGSQLCNLGDSPPTTGCYVLAFTLTGGGIGFPAGALIGAQFPKH